MTAFFIAAFLALFGLMANRPGLWALTHADPRLFYSGAVLFALLGLLNHWKERLPFQRKYTAARIETWLDRQADFGPFWRRPNVFVWAPLLAIGAAFIFYSLRMRLFAPPPTGLGDSLLLLEHVPVYTRLFGYLDSFDELMALFIRSKAYLLGADLFAFEIETSYAILSSVMGGLYCLLLLWFLRGRSYFAFLGGLALFLFSPAVQVYAGYVENYTIASFLLSAMMFIAGRAFEDGSGRPRSGPVLLLAFLAALGVLVHGVVAFVGPALVYIAYQSAGGDLRRMVGLALRAGGLALAVLVPVWIYFFFFASNPVDFLESFAYRPALYPLQTWFSAAHLGPLLNLPLLCAPAALLLFWLAPLISRDPVPTRAPATRAAGGFTALIGRLEGWLALIAPLARHRFYLLATLTFVGHTLVWNPLIGFPADWDLFSFFQAPLHCFVFYRFLATPANSDRERGSNAQRPGALVLAGLLFLSLAMGGGWLARNGQTSPPSERFLERAHENVDRFLNIVATDELFEQIEDRRRRKKYVKALLFVLRSREFLDGHSSPAARSLKSDLENAWQGCQGIMLQPDSSFEAAFPTAWQNLTGVNIRIEEFKQSLPR